MPIMRRLKPRGKPSFGRRSGANHTGAKLTQESIDPNNADASRVRSLELLGKIYGSFAPEKQQVETITSGFFADLEEEKEVEEISSNVFAIKSKA